MADSTLPAPAAAAAQTIEAFVGEQMDDARLGPIHWQVMALVASGLLDRKSVV